jgi:hypothetical protein
MKRPEEHIREKEKGREENLPMSLSAARGFHSWHRFVNVEFIIVHES